MTAQDRAREDSTTHGRQAQHRKGKDTTGHDDTEQDSINVVVRQLVFPLSRARCGPTILEPACPSAMLKSTSVWFDSGQACATLWSTCV